MLELRRSRPQLQRQKSALGRLPLISRSANEAMLTRAS
jgi:hypothetical protein